MSLQSQRESEDAKPPGYKGELQRAIAATDYTSVMEEIKALLRKTRQPREK